MDDSVNSLRDIIPKPIRKKYHFSFKAEILQSPASFMCRIFIPDLTACKKIIAVKMHTFTDLPSF